jgi:tetratricopeptide (TPR) repeat protein
MGQFAFALPQALNRAVSAFTAGNLVEVEQLCQEIIAVDPDLFDALLLLAAAQSRLGKKGAALATYDRAIDVRPDFAEAHFNRGVILQALKHYDEALASFDSALALQPNFARALTSRGCVLHDLKRNDEALMSHERALQLRPDFAQAHFNRGNVLQALNRNDEAVASYDRALALRSNHVATHSNRGNSLQFLKRYDQALASYDRAIAVNSDYAIAHYNRGNVLQDLNRYNEALASYDRAIALESNFAEALSNRGNVLQRLKRFEEAVASYDHALDARPDFAVAYLNRGAALQGLRRFDQALASYESAIKARPDYADAYFNKALCLLLLGAFDRGWEMHEWRWQTEQLRNDRRSFRQPLWLGRDAVAGKTILLNCEQGFGDTIQFCRYVPLVVERGARVILEVQQPLRGLMASLTGATQVISRGDPLPYFDINCPLLSLPLALGTRLETIPSEVPYLHVSPQAVMDWGNRLGPKSRPRIGLAWSGLPKHNNDHNRSISLSALLPLMDIDATFVSLQKDVRPADAIVLNERSDLLHFGDALKDFSDTAALISNLDLVVSIDTSVVHLAGALAKPFWVMLPFTPDWRWLLDRDDSPWYPTARLFRQDETHAWDNVILRMRTALREFIQGSL